MKTKRVRKQLQYATDLFLGTDPRTFYKIERVGADKYDETDYRTDRVRVCVYQIQPNGSRFIIDIIEADLKVAEKWLESRTGDLVRIPIPNPYLED